MQFSREKFQEEYTLWIRSAAKDIAFSINQLKPEEIKKIIKRSEDYLREPESLYGTAGLDDVKKLVPENIILLSTDAVVFSQSIFVRLPSIFDYAVALNRRYFLDSWYSIITLNRTYIKEATDTMLKYTLEHELIQKMKYEENIRGEGKKFTPEEKKKISDDALDEAIKKTGITEDELKEENRLMLKISSRSPLVPKPFAETALYWYLEKNMEELEHFAEESVTEKENELGKKLNSDFKNWIDFSTDVYRLFLGEVKKELDYMDYGYA